MLMWLAVRVRQVAERQPGPRSHLCVGRKPFADAVVFCVLHMLGIHGILWADSGSATRDRRSSNAAWLTPSARTWSSRCVGLSMCMLREADGTDAESVFADSGCATSRRRACETRGFHCCRSAQHWTAIYMHVLSALLEVGVGWGGNVVLRLETVVRRRDERQVLGEHRGDVQLRGPRGVRGRPERAHRNPERPGSR
eukprot:1657148-Rhodomonas_salina.2